MSQGFEGLAKPGALCGARMRAGDISRQSPLVRLTVKIYSVVGRYSSADLLKCAAYDDLANERGRSSLFAVVCNAARDVRTKQLKKSLLRADL